MLIFINSFKFFVGGYSSKINYVIFIKVERTFIAVCLMQAAVAPYQIPVVLPDVCLNSSNSL
jgi:hypothetical protein